MSTTIDEKVVEMRFDNKQFESNVAASMSTIDKLKNSLDFKGATKGLDDIQKASNKFDMSGISNTVETVRIKFSALEVMAVTALANITNSAINTGKNLVRSLSMDQIMDGYTKYEQKTASVQTIMNSTGKSINEVNEYLNRLMWFADETSYGFTDMTSAMALMTSAGGDIEKLIPMITGVANATAYAGKGATEFSRVMYNINQSYSGGFLNRLDWRSVEMAGAASKELKETLIDTAVAMGKIKEGEVTLGTFADSLKDRWADTEVMEVAFTKFADLSEAAYKLVADGKFDTAADAMASLSGKYSDVAVKSFEAAQKAKSFTEAIAATKDAVSSGWLQTFEIVFGNYEQATVLWTDLTNVLWDAFASGAEARNEFLKGGLDSGWSQLTTKIKDIGLATEDFQNELKKTAKEHGRNVDKMIKKDGSFEESLKRNWLTGNILTETLDRMSKSGKGVANSTKDVTDRLTDLQSIVKQVISGKYGNGKDRVDALTKAGYNYAKVQGLVNKVLKGGKIEMDDLSESELEQIGYTKKQIKELKKLAKQAKDTGTPFNELINNLNRPSGRDLLIESLMNTLNGLIQKMSIIKDAWREIFPATPEGLYSMIELLNQFSKGLIMSDESADKLKRSLKGVFAILDIIGQILGGGIKLGLRIFSFLLKGTSGDILDMTASTGDSIVAFRDWLVAGNRIVNVFDTIGNIIEGAIRQIKEWTKNIKDSDIAQSGFAKTTKFLGDGAKTIKKSLSGAVGSLDGFMDRVKDLKKVKPSDLPHILGDFSKNVLSSFKNVPPAFTKVQAASGDLRDKLVTDVQKNSSEIDKFKDHVTGFFSTLKENLSKHVGLGEVLTIGLGVGLIVAIHKINKLFNKVKSPIDAINSVIGKFGKVMDNFAGTLKARSLEMKSKAVLNIAISIGILVAALALLTKLDQKKLWSASGILLALSAGLMILSVAVGKMSKAGTVTKGSLSIITMSIAISLLVNAFKKLDKLDSDHVLKNLGTLGLMALGLAGMAALLNRLAPTLSTGLLAPLAFAASLNFLVSAIAKIDKLDIQNTTQSIKLLFALIIGLSIVSKASKGINKGTAATILAIGISLNIFIGAFKKIADLDMDKMKANMDAFVAIFGTFGGILIASKFAGPNAAKAGVAIVLMSASLLIIVKAFKALSELSPTEIDRATDSVAKILLLFAALTAISKFSGSNAVKAGTMIMLMSVSMLILAGAMALMSKIDSNGLKRATDAITTIGIMFGVLIASTKFAKDAKVTLVLLATTIGILAITLGALSAIDPENLNAASKAMSSVIGTFALLVMATGLAKNANASILILTGVVVALGGVIFMLSSVPAESAIGAAIAISLLLTALSVSLVILSTIKHISAGALLSAGIMVVIIGLLGGILAIISRLNPGPTLDIAKSISLLLIGLSTSLILLAVAGSLGPGAFIGIAALAALIVAVGGIMLGLGKLSSMWDNMETFLDKGLPILEKIGYGLGAFVGNALSGFASNLTAGLPDIGTDLSRFMENAKGFFDGASTIDQSAMNGVKSLAQMIVLLTAADLINGLTSWFTGGTDLAGFGDELVAFGPKFKKYADSISGIKGSDVLASSNAARALSEMAASIPNEGGLLGMIVGNNGLSKFGKELEKFGPSLVKYIDGIKNVKATDANASVYAGKALAGLADSMPNQGGLLGMIVGNNNLSKFGEEIKKFGPDLVAYINSVKNVKATDANASIAAARVIKGLVESLPNSGGLLAAFTGDNTLQTFGEDLVSFSSDLSIFTNNVASIGSTKLQTATSAFNSMIDIVSGANKLDSSGITNFGEKLSSIAKYGVQGFISEFTNANTNIISAIQNQNGAFVTAGSNSVLGFMNGLRSKIQDGSVYGAGYAIGAEALKAAKVALDIHSPSRAMYKVGSFTIDGFVNSIKSSTSKAKITSAVKGMMSGFVKQASSAANVSSYAKGTISNYAKTFVKSTKNTTKATKAATSALSAYIKKMYEESDQYKTDKANIKNHTKALQTQQKERDKIAAKLKKASKKSEVKNLKQQLKEADKAIKEAKKQLVKDGKEVQKNVKATFKAIRNGIKESVKDFMDLLSVSLDSGISLFDAFSATEDEKQRLEETTQLEEELKDATAELADAQVELSQAMSKSAAVDGRSQRFLDKVAEAQDRVNEAMARQQEIQESLDKSKEDTSVQDTLDNMQSQVNGLKELRKNLLTLKNRGLDAGLLNSLKELGSSGAAQVATFVKMTDEELKKANKLYVQSAKITSQTLLDGFKDTVQQAKDWGDKLQAIAKLNLSKTVKESLIESLTSAGVGSTEYIDAILGMTDKQLADFNKTYQQYLKTPGAVADKAIAAAANATYAQTGTLVETVKTSTETATKEATTTAKTGGTETGKAITTSTSKAVKETTSTVTSSAEALGQSVVSSLKKYLSSAKGQTLAEHLTNGLILGMTNNQSAVSEAAKTVAKAAYAAAKTELKIKSPSRKFAELGKFSSLGMANGILALKDKISDASKSVGNTALDAMRSSISSLSAITNGEINTTPTIRPVLDLSNVEAGAAQLSGLFNNQTLNVSGIAQRASAFTARMSGRSEIQNGSISETLKKTEITNHFHISGNNPKEIADEVSKELQRQVDRRTAIWD